MSGLVTYLYQYVGFNEGGRDTHLLIYTRTHAIHWACFKLGNEDCVQRAREVYISWMNNIITDKFVLQLQHLNLSLRNSNSYVN